MKRNGLLFMLLIVISQVGLSQSIQDIFSNEETNYFEKVKQIENYLSTSGTVIDSAFLKRYYRWRYFWDSRVDSNGDQEEYIKAWHEIHDNKEISLNEESSGLSWELVGPFDSLIIDQDNWIGRVSCLAADPNNQNIIYAGANTGGLWKTTNPLDTDPYWECLTDDYAGMGVTDVLIDPNNSDVIYIVTGIHTNARMHQLGDYKGDYSFGAYKSIDGGLTWNTLLGLDPEDLLYLKKIKYDPENSNIMYILSSKAVYKSTNGGISWNSSSVPLLNNGSLNEIVINPLNTSEIYLSGDKGNIFKSTNGGVTWDSIPDATLGNPYNSVIKIAWHPIDSCIYVLYWDGSGYGGVLKKSYDRGNSWVFVRNIGGVAVWVNALAISPSGIIYAGGIWIYKLDDQGNYNPQDTMHADIRDVLFLHGANDTVEYMATDGGVVRNTTGANNGWVSCNGDLSINQFYDIGITEQDPVILLAGAHDCGTLRRKSSGVWEHVLGGDGSTSAIHPGNQLIQFASLSKNLYRTADDWDHKIDLEINFMRYDGPITFHPGNPNTVYVGEGPIGTVGHVLKSTTGGTKYSFSQIGGASGVIYDIEVNESNPDVIYFSNFDWWEGGYSELHKTTNGGTSWTRMIQDTEIGAPINAIVTHPDNPDWVWIAFGGLNENNKVMYSPNGGTSWVDKTHNLEKLPVCSMIYDEANERIIIGNDMGVYYLNNNSTTWEELGDSLPELIVTDLELNKISGDLFISTYGRGIWKLHLDEYCYYGLDFSITGPSLVCTSGATFTLHNRPPGTTVTWSSDFGLGPVSGQGTDNYTVQAISNDYRAPSAVKATITQNGNTCDDPVLQKNVWVGRPGLPVTTPDGDPPMEVIYGRSYLVRLFHPPGAEPSSGIWSTVGSITLTHGNTGGSIVFEVTGWDFGQWRVNTSNSCGTSDTYTGSVYMPMWDFTMYPNPADDYVEIKAEKKEYDTKGIVSDTYEVKILNTLKSPVYQSAKTDQPLMKISTKSFINGIYFVHITAGEQVEVKQLIISH